MTVLEFPFFPTELAFSLRHPNLSPWTKSIRDVTQRFLERDRLEQKTLQCHLTQDRTEAILDFFVWIKNPESFQASLSNASECVKVMEELTGPRHGIAANE